MTSGIDPQPRAAARPGEAGSIDRVADELLELYLDPEAKEMQHIGSYELPNVEHVEHVIDECRALLFPGYAGPDFTGTRPALRESLRQRVSELRVHLQRQIYRAHFHKAQQALARAELVECRECGTTADQVTDAFLAGLPAVRRLADQDVRAAFEGDPAATSWEEIILCYPGVYAVTVHRLAHPLHGLGVPLLPRMMSEWAHRQTGIDIHPGAGIGASFFIDHGTGVVIGETTHIGDRVKLYQGVTLGALSFPPRAGPPRGRGDTRRSRTRW
jgi:serine O-acetyltransferase